MDLIYLDYNCFQRGFDDPQQTRIQMEALACQEIFGRAERSQAKLVWSFMHEDETMLCPFPMRCAEALRLAALCEVRVAPETSIAQLAKSYQQRVNAGAKDAIHLACAVSSQAEYFLTCDDKLLRQAKRLKLKFVALNPIDYVRKGESSE